MMTLALILTLTAGKFFVSRGAPTLTDLLPRNQGSGHQADIDINTDTYAWYVLFQGVL